MHRKHKTPQNWNSHINKFYHNISFYRVGCMICKIYFYSIYESCINAGDLITLGHVKITSVGWTIIKFPDSMKFLVSLEWMKMIHFVTYFTGYDQISSSRNLSNIKWTFSFFLCWTSIQVFFNPQAWKISLKILSTKSFLTRSNRKVVHSWAKIIHLP
jgi:hypothetical protein